MDRALAVSQHDRAEVDLFHEPRRAVDGRDVTNADLVLEKEEEAADDVPDERLRAKADGQARDAGARQHRGDIDLELPENHQDRDADDEDGRHLADRRTERAGAFGALEGVEGTAARHLVLESPDDQGRRPDRSVCEQRDHCHANPRAEHPDPHGLEMHARVRMETGELERRHEHER